MNTEIPIQDSNEGGKKFERKLTPEEQELKENYRKELKQKRREAILKARKEFYEKVSPSRQDLDQRAYRGQLQSALRRHEKRIGEAYDKIWEKYQKALYEGKSNLDQLKAQMEQKADMEVKSLEKMRRASIPLNIEGTYVTTEEALPVTETLDAITELNERVPEIATLLEKVANNGQLTEAEYGTIAGLIQPVDMQKPDQKQGVESSMASVFIRTMNDNQREKLVEAFMNSKNGDSADQLIDAMLSVGTLDVDQAQKLMEKAAKRGIIEQPELEAFKMRVDQGYYFKQLQIHKEVIDKELEKKYKGQYQENFANKFMFNAPMFAFLGTIWSGITMGMNALANRQKGQSWGDYFSKLARNPYFIGAGAAGVASLEVVGSTLKTGELVGSGSISRAMDSWSEKRNEEENKLKSRAEQALANTYNKAPSGLRQYVDAGGYETMIKMVQHQKSGNKKVELTLQSLIDFEKDSAKKQKLESLKGNPYFSETEISSQMMLFYEAANALQIDSDMKLQAKLLEIKNS